MTTKKITDPVITRQILVQAETKTFVLEILSDVRLTFGPWSPSTTSGRLMGDFNRGTLRLYKGTTTAQHIIATYTGVLSFRDLNQVQYFENLDRPICKICKSNLVIPGEDICKSCAGHGESSDKLIDGVLATWTQ